MSRASTGLTACALALLLAGGGGVQAQSSGNPKGSIAPSAQGKAAAPGASRSGAADSGTGPIRADQGPADARMRRTEPPGGGTAGGLTRRNLNANDPEAKARSDKGSAAPRPVPANTQK
ncbi:hypothetical protein [Variovorax sp. LT1R16]|uniref:hypothetical protein n=1 Tax=Variovorax sp. LT1R16 TaxID=3443728 RepID=UPI003F472DE7